MKVLAGQVPGVSNGGGSGEQYFYIRLTLRKVERKTEREKERKRGKRKIYCIVYVYCQLVKILDRTVNRQKNRGVTVSKRKQSFFVVKSRKIEREIFEKVSFPPQQMVLHCLLKIFSY